jgi:uncharacterized protein YjdB
MQWLVFGSLLQGALVLGLVGSASAERICYRSHVQSLGWGQWLCDGQLSGTKGQNRRLEAIQISAPFVGGSVCYEVAVADLGWKVACNGDVAGTTGQSRRVEGLSINYNNAPPNTTLLYRAFFSGAWSEKRIASTILGGGLGFLDSGLKFEAIEVNISQPGVSLFWQN